MINSLAFLYGKGVFTTIAVRSGRPFLWDKHWRRLTAHAAVVGTDLSKHAEKRVQQLVIREIESADIATGKVRITFVDESPSVIWAGEGEQKTRLSVIVSEGLSAGRPIRLGTSPYPVNSRSPLAGIKSCNYLENLLALDDAQARGFDEAIRLNEKGEVTSAVMANVFWLKDGRLHTPSLATGCLAGTTRELVMNGLECVEAREGIDALQNAEAIYLTSAGIGIVSASAFDGQELPHKKHPILNVLDSFDE